MKSTCEICIRQCSLDESFCNKRDKNNDIVDKNKINAISVDLLFDKPILFFTKNIRILSIGSWGCNFRCLGCQNAKLSWATINNNLSFRLMKPNDIIELAINNNCDGIAYTFNEPAIVLDFIEEVAIYAKRAALNNFLITNSLFAIRSNPNKLVIRLAAPLMPTTL